MKHILLILLSLLPTWLYSCPTDEFQELSRILLTMDLSEGEMNEFCESNSHQDVTQLRAAYLRFLIDHDDFIVPVYAQLRFELLQGTKITEIVELLTDFDQVKLQEGNYEFGKYQFDRLEKLYFVDQNYNNDQLDLTGVMKLLVDNYFYDQFNMGINNFVTSVFHYFTGRAPTGFEKEQSKQMCLGESAQLFLQTGVNKSDFLDIMSHNGNFLEYQVVVWYERLLLKRPTSEVQWSIMAQIDEAPLDGTLESIIYSILLNE